MAKKGKYYIDRQSKAVILCSCDSDSNSFQGICVIAPLNDTQVHLGDYSNGWNSHVFSEETIITLKEEKINKENNDLVKLKIGINLMLNKENSTLNYSNNLGMLLAMSESSINGFIEVQHVGMYDQWYSSKYNLFLDKELGKIIE